MKVVYQLSYWKSISLIFLKEHILIKGRAEVITPTWINQKFQIAKKQNSNKFQFFKSQIPNCTLFRYQKFVFLLCQFVTN